MNSLHFDIPEEKFEIVEKYKIRIPVLLLSLFVLFLTFWISYKIESGFPDSSKLIIVLGGLLFVCLAALSPHRQKVGTIIFKSEGLIIQINETTQMHPYSEIYFMEYYIGETAKSGVVSHIVAIKFNDSSTTKYRLAPRYNKLPLQERSDALIQILKQMKSQNNFFVRMKY